MSGKLRAGIGFDIHALVTGRRLVLGGTEIPFAKGLSGWSDADVLIHAIIDALLGAAARGDIGSHFPPGKPEYKDISSLILLARIKDELTENGWQVNNIDTTIVAEKPKLSDYIGRMRLTGSFGRRGVADRLQQGLAVAFPDCLAAQSAGGGRQFEGNRGDVALHARV